MIFVVSPEHRFIHTDVDAFMRVLRSWRQPPPTHLGLFRPRIRSEAISRTEPFCAFWVPIRLDERKLLIDVARNLSKQVGRVRIGVAHDKTDGLARRLAKGRERGRNGEDMLVTIRDTEGVGNEKGSLGCNLYSAICGATDPTGAFRDQIGVILDRDGDFVEYFVDCDEAGGPRTFRCACFTWACKSMAAARCLFNSSTDWMRMFSDNVLCVGCMIASPDLIAK